MGRLVERMGGGFIMSERVELKGMMCAHNVASTGSYGKTQRSVVFTNPTAALESYIWITTAGQEYAEGQIYDISAECDVRGILKRVNMLKNYASPAEGESEQPDPKIKTPTDVFDLIFDLKGDS